MTDFTCRDHTRMAVGYMGWHAQADWFKNRGYKQRKCGECGLWAVVVDANGRVVGSWWAEAGKAEL